jgi:hypothetical protein
MAEIATEVCFVGYPPGGAPMDRSKIISEKRDAARRTRLMARSLSLADDRANLARFAQKLEEEAASMERETGADISNEGHGEAAR